MIAGGLDPCGIEDEKLGVGHLARGHRELAMVAAADMAGDRHIVGLVGQDEAGRRVAVGQPGKHRRIGRVATDQAMGPELEEIAEAGDRDRAGIRLERSLLGDLQLVADHDLVDFVEGEA